MGSFRTSILFLFFFVVCCLVVGTSEATADLIRINFRESGYQDGAFQNEGQLQAWRMHRNASTALFSMGGLGIESSKAAMDAPMNDSSPINHLVAPILPLISHYIGLIDKDDINVGPGVTLCLWLRPFRQSSLENVPILTIGAESQEELSNQHAYTECDERQVDLQLRMQNNSLTLLYRTSDRIYEPCQQLRMSNLPLTGGSLTHIAITLGQQRQQIFVNGKPSRIMSEPFDPYLSHWDPWGVLCLFSYHSQSTWLGQFYQLRTLAGALEQEDIEHLMSTGLPSTVPYIENSTFRINEDAEVVHNSHSLNWYRYPNNPLMHSDLDDDEYPTFNVPITFLEDEMDDILKHYNVPHEPPPQVFVYVTKYPTGGSLFHKDGSLLPGSPQRPVLLPDRQVIFFPDHNAHSNLPGSTYTTIELCVAVENIFSPSQCLSTATVHVVVDSVNDPPIAYLGSTMPYLVHEGIFEEQLPIVMKGSDVDHGDVISAFQVTSQPLRGYLYLSVPSRRFDDWFHGTLLSDMNFIIPGSEALVEYRFNSTRTLIHDEAIVDYFTFRVQDSHGAWSLPVRVAVHVLSNLGTVNLSDWTTALQDSSTTVSLEPFDGSGWDRSLGIFVEFVPEQEDAMVFGLDNEPLSAGSILKYAKVLPPYNRTAGVTFKASDQLCDEERSINTSFGYRVVAFDNDGRLSSISGSLTQNLLVQCKVKPILLVVSQKNSFSTRVFKRSMDDPCSGYRFISTGKGEDICEESLVIRGIQATFDSTHTERAWVNISSEYGRLTLDPEKRKSLRLLKGQGVMRSILQFLAEPEQVKDVLSALHFQSSRAGPDVINITVAYGDCEHTIHEKQEVFECTTAQQSIKIDVLPGIPMQEDLLFDSFPWAPSLTLTLLLLIKFKGKLRILLLSSKGRRLPTDHTTVADTSLIRWKQLYDEATGFYYYLDLDDGTVTWDPPLDASFYPYEDDDDTE